MKITKGIIIGVVVIIAIVALAGMYKFNYLSDQEGYDVDGNKIEIEENGMQVSDRNKGDNTLDPVMPTTEVSHELITGEETFTIGAERVDCVGVAPQKCLIVNGEYFYDDIKGFEYEEGYEYILTVNKEKAFDGEVPADASIYKYTLVEVVSKEKVK